MVKVWDIPTRLFHWLLVGLVALGLITGFLAPEWWMGVHTWIGYGIVVLVVFRLVWSVFGPEYSRIGSFAFPPRKVIEHIRGVLMMRPPHYLGHNPTGAVMIFGLMIVLVGISISGLLTLGGEENQGPLAGITRFPLGDAAKDVHLFLVIGLMAMILIHVVGVIVECRLTRENLVKSMFDGLKPLPEGSPIPEHRDARPLPATVSLVVFTVICGAILGFLGQMQPTGHQTLPRHSDYASECGDCHMAYHPSLLPAKSWQGLMANLGDHFGEDASLDDATVSDIGAYLNAYAGETWDTEAANRFLTVSPEKPWQISESPYWVRKHSEIAEIVFKRKSIKWKGNCVACHKDSDSGRFDDQQINIPKE